MVAANQVTTTVTAHRWFCWRLRNNFVRLGHAAGIFLERSLLVSLQSQESICQLSSPNLGIAGCLNLLFRFTNGRSGSRPLQLLRHAIYYPAAIFPYNLSALFLAWGLFYHNLGWMFVGTFWSAVLGIFIYQWQAKKLSKLHRGQIMGLIIIFLISGLPIYQNFANSLKYTDTYGSNSLNLNKYRPFRNSQSLAQLNHPTSVKITADYPRLNGATALYPMYSAIAQTLYSKVSAKQESQLVRVDSTPKAFDSLLTRKADVIFMASPSKTQFRTAKRHHIHLRLTKIGTEAFVFSVNQKNPVKTLSIKQIQSIYQQKPSSGQVSAGDLLLSNRFNGQKVLAAKRRWSRW